MNKSKSFNNTYFPGYDNGVMFPAQKFDEVKCLLQEVEEALQKCKCSCKKGTESGTANLPVTVTSLAELSSAKQSSIGAGSIVVTDKYLYMYMGEGDKKESSSYTYIGKRSDENDDDPGNIAEIFQNHLTF